MTNRKAMQRRSFLACCSSLGLAGTLFPGLLWAQVEQEKPPRIRKEMILEAERLAGLEFTDAERELMLEALNEALENYELLRTVPLPNHVAPALRFSPLLPGRPLPAPASPAPPREPQAPPQLPSQGEEICFWTVSQLSSLLRTKQLSARELTTLYLERLRRHNPQLECVITFTEELAFEQASRADQEAAAGRFRGPLHGIPWGAKDLFAVPGYPTTWGAMPYKDQVIEEEATVVRRLREAGAVLLAKLSLGALAWGNVWFGGETRNPWNLEEGSSGSSAGSAAATAAGLVGFSLGSETLGSIVSPCTRCGVSGLRPTFGRVSRHGAMALSWSMDKIGPICRSVEDCALVFEAICGAAGRADSVVDLPFYWNPPPLREIRVGYFQSAFEAEREDARWAQNDLAVLEVLRSQGLSLTPIQLPDYPIQAMGLILEAEAAAAFDELTRSNRDDLLVRQQKRAWPNVFRAARFIPAVEYIQANRLRRLVMEATEQIFSDIDVYVTPSYGGQNLLLTNLTGHPAVVVPNGFNEKGSPTSISFVGRLFGEGPLLAVARAYQEATDFHRRHPPAFRAG